MAIQVVEQRGSGRTSSNYVPEKYTALWHGKWGTTMTNVPNSSEGQILSFVRQIEQDKVFAVFNFFDDPQTVTFSESLCQAEYTDYCTKETHNLDDRNQLSFQVWDHKVFVKYNLSFKVKNKC